MSTTEDPPFRLTNGQRYVEAEPIDSVEPHPDNVNEGDVGAIVESMDEHGFFGAIMVQESSRRIIYGEHRWRGALARKATTLPMFFVDVDDDEARRMALVDNESNRKGRNRPDDLARLLVELEQSPRGLAGTGFDRDDLGALLQDLERAGAEPPERRRVEFEAWDGKQHVAPSAAWGDVWQIGPHRIMCGDSFEEATRLVLLEDRAADVVIADPPYAIYGSASGIASDIADDAMVRPFFTAMWRAVHSCLPDFGHAYICCDWRSYPAVRECSKGSGMEPKNCIVWDKGGAGLGSNFANTHEFIAFHTRMPPTGAMTSGQRTGQRSVYSSNIVRHNRPTGEDRQHNAAKPVAMLADFVKHSCDPGGRVLDLFAGSGSTLVAAAAEGRIGLGMEKNPAEVDKIVARLVKVTGLEAERVVAGV